MKLKEADRAPAVPHLPSPRTFKVAARVGEVLSIVLHMGEGACPTANSYLVISC